MSELDLDAMAKRADEMRSLSRSTVDVYPLPWRVDDVFGVVEDADQDVVAELDYDPDGLGGDFIVAASADAPALAEYVLTLVAKLRDLKHTAARLREALEKTGRFVSVHYEDCPHSYCGSECEDAEDAKWCEEKVSEPCNCAVWPMSELHDSADAICSALLGEVKDG